MRRRTGSRKAAPILMASVLSVGVGAPICSAQVTLNTNGNSTTDWTITNGAGLTVQFDPTNNDGDISNISINGSGDLLNPGGGTSGSLDQEFAGTPFGAGTETHNSQMGPNNSYVDVWTTVASTGTTVNPITFAFHYVIFANDPSILVYETLSHASTDPQTYVTQGQFLFRSNPALFPNLYQTDTGPNNPTPVTTIDIPSTNSNYTADSNVVGRQAQNATVDLTGSGIPGDNGTDFFTKYDYSVYNQFYQAETMYGSQYAVSAVIPSMETLTGGPTKQELAQTDPGILNLEFISDHYGFDGTTATEAAGYPGYNYVPTQGANTTRLFGAYAFYIQDVVQNGSTLTAAQLNQNALNDIPNYLSDENADTELEASGYVPTNTNARGNVQINAASTVGWNANSVDDTVVLSQPGVNMQESTQGDQYWGQLAQNGTVTLNNVVPGTYRLTLYQLGQWGETRVDGVSVSAGQVNTPQNVTFTAENFNSTATPVWTIGTPNRSANEFLNGSNTSVTFVSNNAVAVGTINSAAPASADQRQYEGAYNFWLQEQELGNDGKVVYYATQDGATPATNNTLDWIANQWETFNPGLYDPDNDTTDGYTNTNGYTPAGIGTQPAYVKSAGGAGSYHGLAWQVHFTVTQAQVNQGSFVDLSVGLTAMDASLTVALNNHSETWNAVGFNVDDPSTRSGDAGFYQWAVFEFPTSDLTSVGSDNDFTFAVSGAGDGVMYDALRMEIDATGANPSVTGWHDYTFLSPSTTVAPNDALALVASNSNSPIPEPTGLLFVGGALSALLRPRRRRRHEGKSPADIE
jgi:rhamnogalacturonan endolyase